MNPYLVPLQHRQLWTEHDAGLDHDGNQVCLRCGIAFPRMLPAYRTVYTYKNRLNITATIPDATPCQKRSDQWNAQV